MTRAVPPIPRPLQLRVTLPGSKSITLRCCLLAALASGESVLAAAGECEDYWRMKECLRALGIAVDDAEPGVVRITGLGGRWPGGERELFVGASGASTRLLLAACALRRDATTLDGDESMRARPNKILLDALAELGVDVRCQRDGYLPVTLRGPERLGSSVAMRGDVSSQYFSGLMLSAPLLPRGLDIRVVGELVSRPYVQVTVNEMRKFGVEVDVSDPQRFIVPAAAYSPRRLAIEGDASGASYFAALATMHGGTVCFENLGSDTLQGDYRFFEICEQLGARVQRSPDRTTITGHPEAIVGFERPVDMESMPDVAPTLMAMAPYIPGRTKIVGLGTLRLKECDRLAAPAKELSKMGVELTEGEDWIEVGELVRGAAAEPVEVATYDDHRMAMSFAVVGSLRGGVHVRDPDCVRKTYPQFWQELDRCY